MASRRRAEEMITEGRVQVNGQVVTGVGNIYASEVLFRSGIRPRRFNGPPRRF